MGDVLSPFTVSTPPPPSSPSNKNNSMPMLYYGLVVVGTAAMVLAIYNLILLKRSYAHVTRAQFSFEENRVERILERGRSLDSQHRNLLSSFKYTKEVVATKEEEEDFECPVCLSVYEEGEEVRKLPQCKHCFHVICIDMWLYSHLDCPICRTPVIEPLICSPENSRDGSMESGGIVG
ncbi:hypothetical protein Fmac_020671 [Flemingia macrophylla]|uniref:RING-type E3 ubiquitin transferase n=1 Tax=Flemingia macrophylla TaxID=520843 RepID=A0ABD1LUP1_9FABA